MASTTNYSWSTPDDTALVKDGAAAIRSLGSAIDSTVFTNASNVIAKTIVDAKGDLLAGTAADTVGRLASSGVNNEVLTVDTSTATGLKWAPAPAMTLIATATPAAATTISFTSIPTNYKMLILVWDSLYNNSGSDYWSVRFNNDSSGLYSYSGAYGDTGAFNGTNNDSKFGDNNQIAPVPNITNVSTNYHQQGMGVMYIYNSGQTTGLKRVWWAGNGFNTSTSAARGPVSVNGVYRGTSAISQIDFIRSATQTITGTVRLYGVA